MRLKAITDVFRQRVIDAGLFYARFLLRNLNKSLDQEFIKLDRCQLVQSVQLERVSHDKLNLDLLDLLVVETLEDFEELLVDDVAKFAVFDFVFHKCKDELRNRGWFDQAVNEVFSVVSDQIEEKRLKALVLRRTFVYSQRLSKAYRLEDVSNSIGSKSITE